jgi:hypothetical protein
MAYSALPGVRLVSHRRSPNIFGKLDPSVGRSGPHVFAVRLLHPWSVDAARVHRIPASRFVTIGRNVALDGAGWERKAIISAFPQHDYFGPQP